MLKNGTARKMGGRAPAHYPPGVPAPHFRGLTYPVSEAMPGLRPARCAKGRAALTRRLAGELSRQNALPERQQPRRFFGVLPGRLAGEL